MSSIQPSDPIDDLAATIACLFMGLQPNAYWKGAIKEQHPEAHAAIERMMAQSQIDRLLILRGKMSMLTWGNYNPFECIDEQIAELSSLTQNTENGEK